MKIFRVSVDSDYQNLNSDQLADVLPLWGTGTAESYGDFTFPDFYVDSPKNILGNFFKLGPSFAFDDVANDVLGDLVELAGEGYPVSVEDVGTLTYLNVLETSDALDHEKSKWRDEEDGRKILLLSHVYKPDRIATKSGLFRIPETRFTGIQAVTGAPGQKEDFYSRYQDAGLTGLAFSLLWSDES